MKTIELFNIKDCIVVVAGEHAAHVNLASIGYVPQVDFMTYKDFKRGVMAFPEGFVKLMMFGGSVNNHPLTLVKNCEKMVSFGFKGFVLTNSHFVVDSFHVFGKHYNREVRFFLTTDEENVEEVTKDIAKLYKSLATAIDYIDAYIKDDE